LLKYWMYKNTSHSDIL